MNRVERVIRSHNYLAQRLLPPLKPHIEDWVKPKAASESRVVGYVMGSIRHNIVGATVRRLKEKKPLGRPDDLGFFFYFRSGPGLTSPLRGKSPVSCICGVQRV